MRAVTANRESPTIFDVIIKMNLHPNGNEKWEQYRIHTDNSFKNVEFLKMKDENDYNLNMTIHYDSAQLGTQEVWLRRNVGDYQVNLPGLDGSYDLRHEYGYFIETVDGFQNISVEKRITRQNPAIDCSQLLGEFELIPSGEYLAGAPIRLRFSIYGDILEVYANGRLCVSLKDDLACPYTDDDIRGVNFGTTRIGFLESDLTIQDISVDTDYYFWSRKGNRFIYRGQEEVPVGLNTWPYKYFWARDIYDYVNNGSLEGLEDFEIRMNKANEAGARVIRMLLISGGYCYIENNEEIHYHGVDFPFTLANNTRMAKTYWADDPVDVTISSEGFTDYMNEMIQRARERDIFLLPALRHGPSEVWDLMLKGASFNEPDSLRAYTYVDEEQNLIGKVYQLIAPFTDEPGLFAWEYFNEPPANDWIWEDMFPYNEHYDPGEERPERVKDFFMDCSRIFMDENIFESSVTGSMADKHLMSSGMNYFFYAGWYYDKEKVKVLFSSSETNLFKDEVFCRYDDFIDWHSYGNDAIIFDRDFNKIESLEWALNNLCQEKGYNGTCPPIIFGEINPFNHSSVTDEYAFAGYKRYLDDIPNNPGRNWWWREIFPTPKPTTTITPTPTPIYIDKFSLIWDDILVPPVQIQTFDISPFYLRQNQHYKLWKDWYQGISSLKHYNATRKVGFMPWILLNYNGSIPQDGTGGVYDPAIRDQNGIITGYDPLPPRSWLDFYLDEPNVYPFYKHLFKWDWGVR